MGTAIKKHFRDFLAIAAMIAIALFASYVILQEQRLRIPVLEDKPFELKAEFETAQAVVPGQGQTIRVAGVKVGDVQDVELEDGVAVVTFGMDRDYLPVYKDAAIRCARRPASLTCSSRWIRAPSRPVRSRTAARSAENTALDERRRPARRPRHRHSGLPAAAAGRRREGASTAAVRTSAGCWAPAADEGSRRDQLEGRGAQGRPAAPWSPTSTCSAEGGRQEREPVDLVRFSNTTIGAIAEQDPSVQRAIRELPGTPAVDGDAQQRGAARRSARPRARRPPPLRSQPR